MQSYAWTSPQWTLPLPACRAGNLQEKCWQTWVFWMKSFKDRLTVHGHCGVWTRVCRRCFSLGQRCWNETATLKFQPYLSRFNSELSTSAPLHRGCFAECDLHQNPAALNEWTTHRLMKWLDMFVRREKTEGAEACWRMPIWGSEAGVWKISSPPSYSTCDFGMFITVVCMWMFSFPFLSSFEQGLFPSHNLPLNPFSASAFWSYDQRCANDVMWAAKSEIHFSTIYPSKPYQIVTVDLYGFCCRPRGSYCIYLWFVRKRRIKMKATQNGTCLGVPGHKQCKQCMLDWVYWVLVLISGYHLSQRSHERLWKGGRESSCEPWHPVEPELISLSAYEPRSSLKVSWGASDLFRVREQLKATSRCFERSHSDPFATPMP